MQKCSSIKHKVVYKFQLLMTHEINVCVVVATTAVKIAGSTQNTILETVIITKGETNMQHELIWL